MRDEIDEDFFNENCSRFETSTFAIVNLACDKAFCSVDDVGMNSTNLLGCPGLLGVCDLNHPHPPTPAMEHTCWFTFDNQTTPFRDKTSGKVLPAIGAPMFALPGVGGGAALHFDGTNRTYVVIAEQSSLVFGDKEAFSVMFWFRVESSSFLSFLVLKNRNYGVQWRGLQKPLGFYNGQNPCIDSNRTIWNALTWYHVIYSDQGLGGRWTVYIDGALEFNVSSNPSRVPSGPLLIGGWDDTNNGQFFKGDIDNCDHSTSISKR